MLCVLKARINPQLHRPGNLKEVACFKILTESYPYKTSSTFSFNRLFKSNIKVHTIYGVCGNNKESST